ANLEKIQDKNVVRQLVKILTDKGVSYSITSNSVGNFEGQTVGLLCDSIDRAEILIVLGGDGTVLNAVKTIGERNIPLLCINLGTLGFLTEVEYDEIEYAISCVFQNRYTIEERSLLQITYENVSYFALNELVLSKGHNTRPIYIQVEYDGKLLDKYLADGLIVSTPTGSTAYSLSCGGPILGPDIKAIIVNTVCAHSLHSRPIVMADTHAITVSAPELFMEADLVIDGQFICNVSKNKPIYVVKAKHSACFIKLKNEGFYDKLLKKLNYWGVTSVDKE
ncbi:MAG: NAD(+)/NADH kinase, partial [Clostridia bacterium]